MKVAYYTKISGTSFHQDELARLKPGETALRLVPRPDNEYDQYAVEVQAMLDDWVQIGWIQKGKNEEIQKALMLGEPVRVECIEVTGKDKDTLGCNIGVEYGSDSGTENLPKQIVTLGDSPFIFWSEATHTAYDQNKKELYSGSKIEKFPFKEFNPTFPARALSKKTGVKQEDIVSMWEWSGDVSSQYGTLIHKAMEHYWLYNEQMMMLDEAKNRDCRAWNWMPEDLGRIVEAFLEHLHSWNTIAPEVRVKFEQYTGVIDMLEDCGDCYKIHDYKVVKELKEVKYPCLDDGKVPYTKYTLQQNCYRYIIEQATGKPVEAMVLHQWNGNKWTTYSLKRISDDIYKEELWKKKQ